MASPDDLAALGDDPVRFLDHADPSVRRLAVVALATRPARPELLLLLRGMLSADPSPRVRAEAAEALGRTGTEAAPALLEAAADPEPVVVEAVATALGEAGDPEAVPWLVAAAREHPDRLVREAAVASLGAIGDERALPVLLDLVRTGSPQVRRRCVAALTVFDGSDVESAIRAAARDRNPMVREAAQMVVGRPTETDTPDSP